MKDNGIVENRLVNFLVVGAQKAGTSALAEFLKGNPEICLYGRKEAHFFNAPKFDDRWSPLEIEERYRRFFPDYTGQPLVGEATPAYLFLPAVAERIFRYNPRMKIIILLRDPVERALSQYAMERARGTEQRPLLFSLLTEWWRFGKKDNDSTFGLDPNYLKSWKHFSKNIYSFE